MWFSERSGHSRHNALCETDKQKCKEQKCDLSMVFIDLSKAHDTVSRKTFEAFVA